MKDWLRQCVCPYCGKHNDMAADPSGQAAAPKDGDRSLCIGCGHVGVFEAAAPGGVRKTTPMEAAQLAADPRMLPIRRAWLAMDQVRRVRAGGK